MEILKKLEETRKKISVKNVEYKIENTLAEIKELLNKKELKMNLAEKILAAHCGKKKVVPGEFINVKADVILSNDITAPIAIKEFRKIGVKKVFDPKKIVMVADHFVPNKDITSAEQTKFMREFAWNRELCSTMSGRWASSTACCRKKALFYPAMLSSGRTHIPAPTARWGLLPPVWVPPILPRRWPPAISG